MLYHILTIEEKQNKKFLQRATKEVRFLPKGCIIDGKELNMKELSVLLSDMKRTMHAASGIGLSANQIGINGKFFIAQVPDDKGKPAWYAVFNPMIEKASNRIEGKEEGCLSIPLTYGNVPRADRVVLTGFDKNGKPVKHKAWGLLAQVFQHEVDHLNGKLFIDRTKDIHRVPESDRLRERKEHAQ